MSLTNKYTDNIFMDESSILDTHLRLLFRAFHYETPCTICCQVVNKNSFYWVEIFYTIKVSQRGHLDPVRFGVIWVI